jgi:hypothetical protein
MQFRLMPPHLPRVHTIVTLVAERLSVNPASVMNLRQATRLLVLSHLVAAIHRRDHCCIEKGLGKDRVGTERFTTILQNIKKGIK